MTISPFNPVPSGCCTSAAGLRWCSSLVWRWVKICVWVCENGGITINQWPIGKMMRNHLILGYAIFRYSDSQMWKWIRLPMKYQGNIQQYQVFCCDQGTSAVWGKTSTGTPVFITFPSQTLWHSWDIKTCQDMSS